MAGQAPQTTADGPSRPAGPPSPIRPATWTDPVPVGAVLVACLAARRLGDPDADPFDDLFGDLHRSGRPRSTSPVP